MTNQCCKGINQSCVLIILLMLTGCAGSSVVSKNEAVVPTYKLNAAHVTWVNNHSISLETSALVQTHSYEPKLTEADKVAILAPYKADSNRVMAQLLSYFSEHLVQEVRLQLANNNVNDGDDVILQFSPVSVHHVVNGGSRIHLRVAVKQMRDSKEVWSETIETHGSKEDNDQVLLNNFVSTLMDELKKAGWLKS